MLIGVLTAIGIIGAYREYGRMYEANTNAILDSLDKLKELDEDR